MNYRKFGNTDLTVSEIGFGAWAIGGTANVGGVEIGWGPSDDEVSVQALNAALDAGINFYDTADFYGLGHSEKLIGEVFGNRKDVLIATKVGQKVGTDGKPTVDYSKEYLIEACENSLRRLKRDVIDYYQLHVARVQHLEDGACIEAMETLKEQGKIRYWGSSLITFSPSPEAEFLMQKHQGNGFQLVLNLINQLAVPEMENAGSQGYGIIARMPLQFGLLSGKITPESTFSQDDHRSYRLTPELIRNTLEILNSKVLPMAKAYETSLSALALSFILGFKEISTVIPGIRTPRHVELNTQGLVQLSKADHQYLRELYQSDWQQIMQAMQAKG
ncbi:aldo/keto reductase [Algoriphagus sp. CAU 1675]|uniref:aldo/keto reductase n=1 Tax=Algoriphagus sp. CAU 1675 TaxID=3032597 RepID=UPI0023D99530|nr:aldo/keto reductase [Algoriphagus sp. CAU 1675]MDF2158421.1 aldo/keto reductase [Algoriphagus sp. CAU 1675]